jgi:hypothetical protein
LQHFKPQPPLPFLYKTGSNTLFQPPETACGPPPLPSGCRNTILREKSLHNPPEQTLHRRQNGLFQALFKQKILQVNNLQDF